MMKKTIVTLLLCLIFVGLNAQDMYSPSKNIKVTFNINKKGQPTYQVNYKNNPVVLPSIMGLSIKDANNLTNDFEVTKTETLSFSESWQPVLGEQSSILNKYNQTRIFLNQKDKNNRLKLSIN